MKDISFTRGDTFAFKIKMNSEKIITKEDIDTLFVTCRETASDLSPVLFQKTLNDVVIENNYIHIQFNPEDTQHLPYGDYCFDVELTIGTTKKTKFQTFKLDKETTIAKKDGDA